MQSQPWSSISSRVPKAFGWDEEAELSPTLDAESTTRKIASENFLDPYRRAKKELLG